MTNGSSNNGQPTDTKIALLIEQGVEDIEFQIPYNALCKAGAEVVILGSRVNENYRGKQGKLSVQADGTTTEARAEDFKAVIIPGGYAPDTMRTNMKTVRFVQDAMNLGVLIAAVCHGPQVLIEADILRDREATGFRSIRKDMQNAGAVFIDQPLIIDGNLITSRRPSDLPIFTTAILTLLDLSIADTTLPDITDMNAGWWKLAEEWGGSSKGDIVDAINTAIAGERYARQVFQNYLTKAADPEVVSGLDRLLDMKALHLQTLEQRLDVLGETPSLQASASGIYGTLKSTFQTVNSDVEILRHVLGDMQTGVVDTYRLWNHLTDPITAGLFEQMEIDMATNEQWIADLYQARLIADPMQPPQPTTGAAVKG